MTRKATADISPMAFGDDDQPREVPVTVFGTDYKLVEASGEAARQYKCAMSDCAEIVGTTEDGKPRVMVRKLANLEPLLVSLCLFSKDTSGKFTVPVQQSVIGQWPSHIVTGLYERAKSISALDEEEESYESLVKQRDALDRKIARVAAERAAVKNSQPPTPAG